MHPLVNVVVSSIGVCDFVNNNIKNSYRLLNIARQAVDLCKYFFIDAVSIYSNYINVMVKSKNYDQATLLFNEIMEKIQKCEKKGKIQNIENSQIFIKMVLNYANCLDRMEKHNDSLELKLKYEKNLNNINNLLLQGCFLNNMGYSSSKLYQRLQSFEFFQKSIAILNRNNMISSLNNFNNDHLKVLKNLKK